MSCKVCDCAEKVPSGNTVHGIPVKVGEPLSTACQRTTAIGSIPEVFRLPAFTLVNGATVENCVSNAGIQNMSSFFKSRRGCYSSLDSRLSGSSCC